MKVAVLGSGGGALAVAADMSRSGRDVMLADLPAFAGNLDAVREQGGVGVATGWSGVQQEAVGVADSVTEATKDAALVIVVVPCFGHEPFMRELAPMLRPGQSLLFLGEGSGSIVARRALSAVGANGVVVGETNTLPYLARPVRAGVVTADRKSGGVLLAATPASDTEALRRLVEDVWPYVSAAESVWDAVLINFNAIDHVPTMLANAGTLENRTGGMLLWGRAPLRPSCVSSSEWTPSCSRSAEPSASPTRDGTATSSSTRDSPVTPGPASTRSSARANSCRDTAQRVRTRCRAAT